LCTNTNKNFGPPGDFLGIFRGFFILMFQKTEKSLNFGLNYLQEPFVNVNNALLHDHKDALKFSKHPKL
jgi:hypothetical protein